MTFASVQKRWKALDALLCVWARGEEIDGIALPVAEGPFVAPSDADVVHGAQTTTDGESGPCGSPHSV